jgi:hypothetical protein
MTLLVAERSEAPWLGGRVDSFGRWIRRGLRGVAREVLGWRAAIGDSPGLLC